MTRVFDFSKSTLPPLLVQTHWAAAVWLPCDCHVICVDLFTCLLYETSKYTRRIEWELRYFCASTTTSSRFRRIWQSPFAQYPGGHWWDTICLHEKAGKRVGQEKISTAVDGVHLVMHQALLCGIMVQVHWAATEQGAIGEALCLWQPDIYIYISTLVHHNSCASRYKKIKASSSLTSRSKELK